MKKLFPVILCLISSFFLQAQEFNREPALGLLIGSMNYQGDLNPNSFSFGHSKFTVALTFRKPLNRWIAFRAGAAIGKIEAADRYNRDYLKPRNLSFISSVKEVHTGLEFTFIDISKTGFTFYLYAGIAVFGFNPWTYDNNGNKTYLKPLSTEGQGLSQFPSQKPYNLIQWALPLGTGIKYAVSENLIIGIEFSQRKTFTDYLDDVSSFYVDRDVLLQAKGTKAVDLAWRSDEIAENNPYPEHGEQRGTPTEMDWYYFAGLNVELRLSAIKNIFSSLGSSSKAAIQRCPRFILGY